MGLIKTYKELTVWQKSITLVTEIYQITNSYPKSEIYSLTNQMRRCAVSIPSNIAEGYGRKSQKEYLQFYSISYGSSLELETQIIISKNLHLVELSSFRNADLLLVEVQKMLHAMIYALKNRQLNAKP
jgi:four helix bundle protein